MATFDTMPCLAAKLNDVNTDLLHTKYLIPLLGNELVESDTRPIPREILPKSIARRGKRTEESIYADWV